MIVNCLCCRDTGLVTVANLQVLDRSYTLLSPAVVCQRPGCRAALQRYDSVLSRLDTRLSPEQCQLLHNRQVASLTAACQHPRGGVAWCLTNGDCRCGRGGQ